MCKSVMAACAALTLASPALAQEITIDELRAGVFYHSAYSGFLPTGDNWELTRLEDVKFSALFTSPDIEAFRWIGSPRPEIGATLNLNGRENILHANLNWQIPVFDTPLYLELGFGAAVTDGALTGAIRPERNFGCSFNFYDAAGIGANVGENMTVTLRYEHISNLDLCPPNEGLSNIGLMVGFKF